MIQFRNPTITAAQRALIPADVTHALTLRPPWGHFVMNHTKRVENLTWAPADHWIGKRIAIHEGKQWDTDSFAGKSTLRRQLAERGPGIIGIARIAQILGAPSTKGGPFPVPLGLPADQIKWWSGPVGIVLDFAPLTSFLPCSGALGFWPLTVAP